MSDIDISTSKPVTTFRVRYSETDKMGIVHHSSYVLWLEMGRVEWLRSKGLSYRQLDDGGVALPVSKLEVNYKMSADFDDELDLYTEMVEARSRRFTFIYKLVRKEDSAVLVTGQTIHVPINREGTVIRCPSEWLEKLQQYVTTS